MGSLTKQQVAETSNPGRYGDGNGLYLVVSPGGSKNWIQRVRISGKRTDKGLGGVAKVSLGQARKIATANVAAIQQGRNPFDKSAPPVIEEAPPTIPTFADAARAVHKINAADWGDATACKWIVALNSIASRRWATRA